MSDEDRPGKRDGRDRGIRGGEVPAGEAVPGAADVTDAGAESADGAAGAEGADGADGADFSAVETVPDARHRLTAAEGSDLAGDATDAADAGANAAAGTGTGADAGAGTNGDGSDAADLPHAAPQLVIITGMSGAGRSTAAKVFEDLGWYVVDNLAPTLIAPMVDLVMRESGGTDRLAFVVDVRGRAFFDTLRSTLDELDSAGLNHRIVFLESDDDVLVRRYEGVRRPHPLQGEGRVLDGIARERELLRELRGEADQVLDTSARNVHELRAALESAFGDPGEVPLRATVMSFGFKYGLPVDADLVADVRFLPNPHWVPELRPHTGQDPEVSGYVLSQHGAKEFLDRYAEVLNIVTEGYRREGKRYLTLAIGCTGGKHRSVAMSEQIAARLSAEGVDTVVVHRDMGRE